MDIVFFGSSPFSTVVLEKIKDFVVAVVTKPDAPVGRHLKMTPNPVKVLAQKYGLNVQYSMSNVQCDNCIGLVAAYGKIIKQEVLDKFSGQIYNIHPSLLPKYRGPSPLQQQILDGVVNTGVTIIKIDNQMDHGPIIAQARDVILPDDTAVTLGNRLFVLGADLILNFKFEILNQIPISQNHNEATYTKLLTRQDGYVVWDDFKSQIQNPKSQIYTKFRAFFPWPGVWSIDPQGQRVKLVSLSPFLIRAENPPQLGNTPPS